MGEVRVVLFLVVIETSELSEAPMALLPMLPSGVRVVDWRFSC